MSRLIRAQVVFRGASGLSKDQFVNNFTFLRNLEDGGQDDEVAQNLLDFYGTATTTTGQKVLTFLSPAISAGPHRIKLYDLNQAPPRVPVFEQEFTWGTAPTGTALPSEVAVCLSARAERVSGTIDARRRGRVYIGPLNTTAMNAGGTGGHPRVEANMRTTLLEAAARLAADMNTDGWLWGVHSSLGAAGNFVPFRTWWVDDAFDTQRRRGMVPTTKQTATVTQLALAV